MPAGRLFGREHEEQALADLIARAGASLVLRGDAGIGKSALLSAAVRMASARGMQVLTTVGVQAETDLAFAGLHQLLRPVMARVDELPRGQREAVAAAFGMGETGGAQPFLIALGALGVLTDASADQPLMLIVEDGHWLDRPSADALAFVGRRIASDPIVLLAAIREGYDSPLLKAGLPELRLAGLADAPARALLDTHVERLAPAVLERLVREAEGNPLALLELPVTLEPDGPLPARLPLSERLERTFAARARELPSTTRTLLLIAATDEAGVLDEVLAATRVLDGAATIDDLAPATAAQLVAVAGQSVAFRHPLVRSAIYQAATVGERQAAHAALAEVLAADSERRVWHRAAAAVGRDREVAAELEETANRALRRGAVATAEMAFERAAALSQDAGQRGRLLLRAAEAAIELGRSAEVLVLLREADSLDLDALERARLMWLEDEFRGGRVGEPGRVRALVAAAESVAAAGERDLALALLTAAAGRCNRGNLIEEGRAVVSAADGLGVDARDQRLLYIQVFAQPAERGAIVLRELDRTATPADAAGLYLRGIAICLAGAFDRAAPLLAASAARLREQGRLRMLSQVLAVHAWAAVMTSDFAVGVTAADEAIRLAAETAQPLTVAVAAQAAVAALRGDRAAVERLTAEAERSALPLGAANVLSLVQYARGLLELGQGRHAEAYEQLMRIGTPGDVACHGMTFRQSFGDLAEAAVHCGHREAALALMRELEPQVRSSPASWGGVTMRYGRVLLAAEDDAQHQFEQALAEDLTAWPLVRARLNLAYGEWLRRQRHVAESRSPLRAALEAFDALGVLPWAERARRELRAAGELTQPRVEASLSELTAQELQIVQLAVQGLSNREIAERLYLSHRTVESHLYRVFPKLGVTSRAQLAHTLGGQLG